MAVYRPYIAVRGPCPLYAFPFAFGRGHKSDRRLEVPSEVMAPTRILRSLRGALPAIYTIGLALVAGVVAFEICLALTWGRVGIPGLVSIQVGDGSSGPKLMLTPKPLAGGESVSAKLPPALPPPTQPALSQTPTASPPIPPQLSGLDDVPWVQEPKTDEGKIETETQDRKLGENKPEIKMGEKEVLPWEDIEPVPFSAEVTPSNARAASAKIPRPESPIASGPTIPIKVPAIAVIKTWIKASAIDIKGKEQVRPLHHFEFWLDAPEDIKRQLVAVAYEFNTPAVMPQSQVSRDEKTGFRISAGGLTCPDLVTVTLQFSNGQSQQVAVDGCQLLR